MTELEIADIMGDSRYQRQPIPVLHIGESVL